MSDSIKQLEEIGAEITSMTLDEHDGIVSIQFKINGACLKAQADIDTKGLYAIQIASLADLQKLINGE
jgi:prephenate dehydrogenase